MKYLTGLFLVVVYILGLIYLVAPTPTLPHLSDSHVSDEPGDTWQNPDQIAFYTNKTRSEVISELESQYQIKILGFVIPTIRFNYPPEESFRLVRDQVPSYYLEEVVYPFHSSFFINGWEPSNHPKYQHLSPADRPVVTYKGETYLSKVTLRPVVSSIWSRILIWTLIFPAGFLVYKSLKSLQS